MSTSFLFPDEPPRLDSGSVEEISRLYAQAQQNAEESRQVLDHSLLAAWQTGKLLCLAQKSITRCAGRDAWIPWLETHFQGSVKMALRYMQLARGVVDPSKLQGMSLRQAYCRLGIVIEPKLQKPTGPPVVRLTAYIEQAAKLTRTLRTARRKIPFKDLEPLCNQLRLLFE